MSARRPRLLVVLLAAASIPAQGDAAAIGAVPDVVRRHCAACHEGAEAERGFEVAAMFGGGDTPGRRERLAAAVQRLRSRTMPPPDAETLPDEAARRELVVAFAGQLPAEPGARVATARRLSRRQYEHTVQDLTGLAWRAHGLPEDVRAHGFDSIGDVAGITPMLFETYFAAAGSIAAAVMASPAARQRLLPAGVPVAEALRALLERAFRRLPWPEEVDERVQLFVRLRSEGRAEAEALAAVLQSVLASPAFLLRTETGRPDAPHRLTGHELATRLAYLLTSSMPDDELLAAARSGELVEPALLVAQARRLVVANGGRRLAEDFAAQWLRFRDVLTANADFRRYPQIWNGNLRPALHEEAAAFFASIVREDLSVLNLLDADFTYVDATLAKHYGLPAVTGEGFQRVALDDRRRGGVLGMGAMLMVSSYPLRTSPVQRGKWILDTLLDASTPPPPPGAGTLPADDTPVAAQSLRAQLERHRRDRACASCHAQIDPLGFALENYDVLGRWRSELHGEALDVRGTLPDGTAIDGPVALKDVLLARKDDFVRAFAGKLLTFGIGRPMLLEDEPELARVVAATAAGGYTFSALLAAVVTSPLFTLRDPAGP